MLPEVQAYVDWRRFGVLPHAGGTFDQPAELLAGMRYVAARVEQAEKRRQPKGSSGGGKGRLGRLGKRITGRRRG